MQELAKIEQDLEATISEVEGRKRYQMLETEIQGLRTKIELLEQEVKADQVGLQILHRTKPIFRPAGFLMCSQ